MTRLSQLSRSVEGKVVLVTGAASGMGRATAELFADEGAKVIVTDLTLESAEPVAAGIREAGGEARAWALDVGDPDAITRVVAEIASEMGGLDILVNNAGISTGVPIESEAYDAALQRSYDVMLTAHARLVRHSLPHLKQSGEGRVINIASTEGLGASRGAGPYTVAKHGVIGLTRSLAMELGQHGITVNCICPGPILTGMTAGIPEPARNKFARRRVPLRRYAIPEEVAHMTLNLALPASSYVTGTTIPVDGGLTIQNT
ncbi:MAG: SDR family NAD(P)-dependent oxidoreductase [Myxococcota bacterium]|nr:SDR family NAD(P)-dependent oxidoreductase [Myxococcota bacterium]